LDLLGCWLASWFSRKVFIRSLVSSLCLYLDYHIQNSLVSCVATWSDLAHIPWNYDFPSIWLDVIFQRPRLFLLVGKRLLVYITTQGQTILESGRPSHFDQERFNYCWFECVGYCRNAKLLEFWPILISCKWREQKEFDFTDMPDVLVFSHDLTSNLVIQGVY